MKRSLSKFLAFSVSLCLLLASAITPVNADQLQSTDGGIFNQPQMENPEQQYYWRKLGNAGFSTLPCTYSQIAFDENSIPYVVINAGEQAEVQKFNGSSWETVGNETFEMIDGERFSFALSKSGTPYITYIDINSGVFTVKKFDGSNWVELTGFGNSNPDFISLATDNDGNLYAAFVDSYNRDRITVLKYVNGIWQNIGETSFMNYHPYSLKLTISNDGIPYIAFDDSIDYTSKATVMKYDGIREWETVGNADFTDGNATVTQILVDNNNIPYIALNGHGNFESSVMKYDGSNWVNVGNIGGIGNVSLALDNNDTLWAVCFDTANNHVIKIQKYFEDSWVTVGSQSFSSFIDASIAINNEGTPYVVFRDVANNNKITVIQYVIKPKSNVIYDGNGATGGKVPTDNTKYFLDDTVTVLGNKGLLYKEGYKFIGWNTASDGSGTDYAANETYIMGETDITLYAKWQDISEQLNWQTVGSEGISNNQYTSPSIEVDGKGIVYVAYNDFNLSNNSGVVKKYNGSSWVNVGDKLYTSIFQGEIAMKIDNNDIPYVAYRDFTNSNKVTVKKLVGNNWVTVGTEGVSDGLASNFCLAIDKSGNIYVAYSDYEFSNKLTVKKFDGSNWVTVGTEGFSAEPFIGNVNDKPSIAIDKNGKMYVAFNGGNVYKLDGDNWTFVDEAGLSKYNTSETIMTANRNGDIYLLFNDNVGDENGKITVMKLDGSNWTFVESPIIGYTKYLNFITDANNNLILAFDCGKLTVEKFDGTNWYNIGTSIFSHGNITEYNITTDKNGIPYMFYFDENNIATVKKYNDGVTVSVDSVKAGYNDYDGNWTCDDVTITLNGDATTGIKKFQYSTDNGLTWTDVEGTELSVNQTLNKDYIFRAESNGNLTSVPSEPVTIKVDKTLPIIENITGNPTKPVNVEQSISFAVDDIDSGISPQSVTVTKGDKDVPCALDDGKYTFTTEGNGQYIINASDNAGNTVTQTVEVTKIDLVKPTIKTLTPADKAENIDATSLTIIFSEHIKKVKNGDIIVCKKDGTVFEKTNIFNNRIKIKDDKLTINLSKPLEKSTSYYVTIANDIISDLAGNTYSTTEAIPWSFTTADELYSNALLGIDISNMGEQYSAVDEGFDTSGIEGSYSTIAIPNEDGTADITIIPKFAISGTKFSLSTEEEGVTITDNKVKMDAETNQTLLQISYTENNDIGDVKVYYLTIYKGNIDENIVNEGMGNIYVNNLKGAFYPGLNQLEFNLTKNILTAEQMSQIKDIKGNQSIALSFNSELVYTRVYGVKSDVSNIQDIDTENGKASSGGAGGGGGSSHGGGGGIVKYTQNPITIGIQMPSEMLAGSNYKVLLLDNGNAEIIDCQVVNNYLEFNTDRLGEFILLYTPKPKSTGGSSGGGSKKNNSSNDVTMSIGTIHSVYMNGYEDNTFMPDNNITRAEIATITAKLSGDYKETQNYESNFKDIKAGSWSEKAIGFCNTKGLMKGYEDGTFNPDGEMTRAEFAAVIARFKGLLPEKATVLPYSDISGHWAEDYIMALYKQGWISGYEDGTFKPDEFITRAEAVKMINAMLGRTPTKEHIDSILVSLINPFTDVMPTHWAYYEILEATINHTNYTYSK